MEEKKQRKKQVSLMIIGVVVLVIGLVGVTYAFFNYTRTGSLNTIRVGKMNFSSNQTETIGLVNVFPISSTDALTDTTNTDEAIVTITGDTTYNNGIEYLISVVDVRNTINNKKVPISISVTASNGLGTSDNSYFTNRGNSASTHLYKVLADEVIDNNGNLVVGYIKNSSTGVNGSVTIKAYLDKSRIGISDTYNGLEDDDNGTTDNWSHNRTILTTEEWNSLQSIGLSFKIKVEANEGVWVSEEVASTPAQYFVARSSKLYEYNENRTAADIAECVDALRDIEWDDYIETGETLESFCAGTGTLAGTDIRFSIIFEINEVYLRKLQKTNIVKLVKEGVEIINYDENGGTDVVIPNRLPITTFTYNSNRSSTDIENCANYLEDATDEDLYSGETFESFCAGTGTAYGDTFEEVLKYNYLQGRLLLNLVDLNMVNTSTSTVDYEITEIGYESFYDKGLTSVKLPKGLKYIWTYAFEKNNLTNIEFPNGLETIGYASFATNNLLSIDIPDSVLYILSYPFMENSNLTQIKMSDALYNEHIVNCTGEAEYPIADNGVELVNKSNNNSCIVNVE